MHPQLSPETDDAAERALMAACAITPERDRVADTATAILAQICPDQALAATRVEEMMKSMLARGALERLDPQLPSENVVARFEHLLYENRKRIRFKKFRWEGVSLGRHGDLTAYEVTPEPWLPITAFQAQMQDTLRRFLEDGTIASRTQDGDPLVAESDYLACHPASREESFRPLTDFKDNPGFVRQLLDEHAASRTLVVRSGLICVPWHVLNDYATPGASPLDFELRSEDVPMHDAV